MIAGFEAFVVPTAIRKVGDKVMVEATLVAHPFTTEETGVKGQDGTVTPKVLSDWPAFLRENVLGALKPQMRLRRVIASEGSVAFGPDIVGEVASPRLADCYARERGEPADYVAAIARLLWGRVFSDQGGANLAASSYRGLARALFRTFEADTLPKLIDDTKQGRDGESPTPDKPPTPDILSVPRAELGHLLRLARAKVIGDRLDAFIGNPTGSVSHLPREPSDLGAPWTESSKLGLTGPDGRSSPNANPDPKNTQDNLKAALKDERKKLKMALADKLSEARNGASRVAEAYYNHAATPSKAACQDIANSRRDSVGIQSGARGAAEAVAGSTADFNKERESRLAAHVASNLPDTDDARDRQQRAEPTPFAHRWATVLGIASLQRALHLVVDIEAEMPVGADVSVDYYVVDIRFSETTLCRCQATLARVGLKPRAAGPPLLTIWPCAAEEMTVEPDCRRVSGAVDQTDGLIDLESQLEAADRDFHRFAIETLDVHLAAETEIQRDRAIVGARQTQINSDFVKNDAGDAALAERKLRTAGLQIFDQWRGSVAIKQYVGAVQQHFKQKMFLDADDLTAGVALDIGFKVDAGPRRFWSSLVHRRIEYNRKQSVGDRREIDLESFVDRFCRKGLNTPENRMSLDGVIIGMPARLVDVDHSEAAGDDGKTAFQETTIAVWDGDPLGVRCHADETAVPFAGLPLDMTFGLPQGGNVLALPPKLRFGVPYWFGGRTVLIGGVKRPLEKGNQRFGLGGAEERYESDDGPALPGPRELTRFLRHEWIDAPMTATPWPDIARELAEGRGFDGESIVVRRLDLDRTDADDGEDDRRYKPHSARRVLIAPPVDFNFAHLHGVFDPGRGVSPTVGGLQGTDYEPSRGGFPSFSPELPPLANYIRFDARKRAPSIGLVREIAGNSTLELPPSGGVAVFRPRSVKPANASDQLYFPDPAARQMAFALKKPWRGGPHLEGDPIVITLYPTERHTKDEPTTEGFPHACPIFIRVVALPEGADERLTHHSQLAHRLRASQPYAAVQIDESAGHRAENMAFELTISLLPGEDFELVAWAVPHAAHLAAWFDVPESMALLARHASQPAQRDQYLAASAEPNGYVVRREEERFALSEVQAAADRIHAALIRTPIPEIAAPRRLRVTHAAEKPSFKPMIYGRKPSDSQDGQTRALETYAFRRLSEASRVKLLQGTGPLALVGDDFDAASVVADADIAINPDAIDTIELRVKAAAPNNRPLDDVRLGRSAEMQLRGVWPPRPETKTWCDPHKSASRRLYGFDVFPDGQVRFPEDTVTLQRWRIRPDEPVGPDGMSALSLLGLTRRANAAPLNHDTSAVSAEERLFADGGARRLRAELLATSRTANLVPERRAYPDEQQRAIDDFRRHARGVIAGAKSDEKPSSVLRAIVRPATPPIRSVLPAFVWTRPLQVPANGVSLSRSTRIRIPFSRPAMTSGVEERLGIVLWPPNIRGVGIEVRADDPWSVEDLWLGEVRSPEPGAKILKMNVPNREGTTTLNAKGQDAPWRNSFFNDADLGPGGAYITRCGADPIHPEGEVGWFLGLSNFADLSDWSATAIDTIDAESRDTGILWPEEHAYLPRLAENVLMPIPKAASDDGDGGANASGESQFLMVSLLTFAPRFDVDRELWYADVEVDTGGAPDPFLRLGLVRFQPHAARELQVSYPTTEWVQIVARHRDARVEVEKDAKSGRLQAVVTVVAPIIDDFDHRQSVIRRVATTKPACDPSHVKNNECASPEDSAPWTEIRVTLIERVTTDEGMAFERPARLKENGAAGEDAKLNTGSAKARFGSPPGGEWTGAATVSLPLPDPPEVDISDFWSVDYAVYVEEVMMMKAAGSAAEPIEPGEEEWRESGARFALRLDLPRSALASNANPRTIVH